MHSIADLTTFCRRTKGDVPATLVGASTTVIGSRLYLFGGRLVSERKMTANLYIFDLETLTWELVPPHSGDEVPIARYFHSADTWNDHLVLFGGMGHMHDSNTPDDLCVLNDVRMFSLATRRWLPASATNIVVPGRSDDLIPKCRYAHLSSVTADKLFIIGGQDLSNVWLDDLHVFDLVTKSWVQRRPYPRHCGTYRSIAVASEWRVRLPQEEAKNGPLSASIGPAGARFNTDKSIPATPEYTQPKTLNHLPYSSPPTDDFPCEIYLYSNYNFTAVKRELEVFTPLPDGEFVVDERSESMNGTQFPPGLRFPSGALLGNHFIVAGTYIANTSGSFSIWALDITNMTWKHIDPGGALAVGSWSRGCLWAEANKFLVFGNREGNLVDDYTRRLLAWDHVAIIDLESFGVYQPPDLKLEIPMQELGLSALEEGVFADFEIVCDDTRKVKCSRKTLEERWPWFKQERRKFLRNAQQALDNLGPSASYIPLPELPGVADPASPRPDPRLTPRSFHLSEPYPVTLALLQYFYSLALITPLQQAPAVLSQLLILSSTYQITHLEKLVKHAMHRALSNGTSVGVYEVATLCSCRSLQIRALKTVMSYSNKKPGGRSRQDSRGNGSGGGGSGGGGHGGAGGSSSRGNDPGHKSNQSGDHPGAARPRGTSDAQFRGPHDIGAGNRIMLSPAFDDTSSIASSSSLIMGEETPRLRPIAVADEAEILAVADLFSPALSDSTFSVLDEPDADDDANSFIEPLPESESPIITRSRSHPSLNYASGRPNHRAPLDGDINSDDSDEQSEYLASFSFHLPRRSLAYLSPSDSDTPSLTSSASYSSLNTLSHRGSPPLSPKGFTSPEDYVNSIQIGLQNSAEESNLRRVDSGSSLTGLRYLNAFTELEAIEEQSWRSEDSPSERSFSPTSQFSEFRDATDPESNPVYRLSSSRSVVGSGLFTKPKPPSLSLKNVVSRRVSSPTLSNSAKEEAKALAKAEKEMEKQRKRDEKAQKKAEAKERTAKLALELREKDAQRRAATDKDSVQSKNLASGVYHNSQAEPALFAGVGISLSRL